MTSISGFSHRGTLRIRNEDAIGWDQDREVAVLADGMGGHPAGHVASRLAVEAVLHTVRRQAASNRSWLDADGDPAFLIQLANRAVLARARRDRSCYGMGSTLVLVCLDPDTVLLAHAGDSRAYRFRDGRLEQLTLDHTVAQERVEQGLLSEADAQRLPERNMLTRALGLEDAVEPAFYSEPRRPGTVYLLCSDGVWSALERETMKGLLEDYGEDLEAAAEALVRAAVAASGDDNCSAILARC